RTLNFLIHCLYVKTYLTLFIQKKSLSYQCAILLCKERTNVLRLMDVNINSAESTRHIQKTNITCGASLIKKMIQKICHIHFIRMIRSLESLREMVSYLIKMKWVIKIRLS